MEKAGRESGDTALVPASDPSALALAVKVLKGGGLVAFPTDTVYGVGALAGDAEAVAGLYAAKERPAAKAIPVLASGWPQLLDMGIVASPLPPAAARLSGRFWPGPLTLVVPRGLQVPDVVTASGDTVAVRVPDHPVVLHLLEHLPAPLAATSANRAGEPSPLTARDVMDQLGGRIQFVLDGGACPGGVPSTVLDLTVAPPCILRAGPVTLADIQPLLRGANQCFG